MPKNKEKSKYSLSIKIILLLYEVPSVINILL